VAKRLEILRELVPAATRFAVLVNSANAPSTETTLRDVEAAARAIGLQIRVFTAGTREEIDAAFATFGRERPDALFVGTDTFFSSRRVQLVNLATRHASRRFEPRPTEIGALMSYGSNIAGCVAPVRRLYRSHPQGCKPATCWSCRRASSSWSYH
jgi:putative ABC transport system substrate-binding protein